MGEFEDQVWKIQEFLHVKPGKGSAFVRSKMKNLINGAVLEKTWKAGESFPDAQVDKEEMQYSYLDDGDMVFMNLETFEEERIPRADIAKAEFIKDDSQLTILKWRGKAIDVKVPQTVQLMVTEAEPGAKGNSAGGRVEKPVTLETGAVVNVPIFIEENTVVKIDTDYDSDYDCDHSATAWNSKPIGGGGNVVARTKIVVATQCGVEPFIGKERTRSHRRP